MHLLEAHTGRVTSPDSTLAYRPFGRDTWRDPYPLYERLREEDPVHHSPLGVVVLSRFADVHAAARDPATYSSAEGLTYSNEKQLLGILPTVVMMDPPLHTRYRRLVNRAFSPRAVMDLEEDLRTVVRRQMGELVEAGGGDLATGLARSIPAWLLGRYLGVPEQDQRLSERWTASIIQQEEAEPERALADLYGYFVALAEERGRRPSGDLISQLLAAGQQGVEVGLEDIVGYAFVLVAGGNDTTTGLITVGAELLTEYPDQRRLLLEDRSLMKGAVEELLRMTTPVQGLCRVLTTPVELHGKRMGAGQRVLLCYGAADRDPREFGPDAGQLDLTREVRRHLAFASGPHHCLGAAAARLVGRVVFEELLAACPRFAVDGRAGIFADGPFTRRYQHLPMVAEGF